MKLSYAAQYLVWVRISIAIHTICFVIIERISQNLHSSQAPWKPASTQGFDLVANRQHLRTTGGAGASLTLNR
jgi:hypothetical protein